MEQNHQPENSNTDGNTYITCNPIAMDGALTKFYTGRGAVAAADFHSYATVCDKLWEKMRFTFAKYKEKYYLSPRTNPEFMKELENFECREDDIFIATYPKSGTNWMQEIVGLILRDGRTDEANKNERFIVIELADVSAMDSVSDRGPVLRRMKDLPSPRAMATHVHRDLLPKQLHEKKCKVIYVYRHPKDVIVSYYNFCLKLSKAEDTTENFNNFFETVVSGKFAYGSWFDHVLCYSEHMGQDNFLFLSYESMKKELPKVIEDIASFLGRELSRAAIERITAAVSLENMRKTFHEEHIRSCKMKSGKIDRNIYFNKGAVGQWRERFTKEQNEKFDKLFYEKMQGCDLTKGYNM